MKKRRILLFSLIVLLLIVGIPGGYLIRGYRHEQTNRELIFAIKAKQTNRALDALEAHADPNFRDPGDEAPSFRHYLSVLWQQLRGAKPPPPRTGLTALGLAVQQNNTVLVEALLAQGAGDAREIVQTPNKPGEDQGTPPSLTLLMMAAKNKNPAIVQALVRHGWDVNGINDNHETALFYAEDAVTVKTLAACGVNLNARAAYGSTTLDERLKGEEEVVEALLDLGAHDPKALSWAISFDNTAALKKMIALGWKMNERDEEGQTPLTCALYSPGMLRPDVASILIKSGAIVSLPDGNGDTPLLLAADGGRYPEMDPQSPAVVKALLAHGAPVDGMEEEGFTPLMTAAFRLRPVLVQLLLQHGAQVNRRTKTGKTALSIAQASPYVHTHHECQPLVIRLLKAAGARK